MSNSASSSGTGTPTRRLSSISTNHIYDCQIGTRIPIINLLRASQSRLNPKPTNFPNLSEANSGTTFSPRTPPHHTDVGLDDSGYESPVLKSDENDTPLLQTLSASHRRRRAPSVGGEVLTSKIPVPILISPIPSKLVKELSGDIHLPQSKGQSSSDVSIFDDAETSNNIPELTETSFLRLTKSTSGSPEHGMRSNSSTKSLPIIRSGKSRGDSHFEEFGRMTNLRKSLKASPNCQFPIIPAQLPSFFSLLKGSESLQEVKKIVDRTVQKILEEGQAEFGQKYAQWIHSVFNHHLIKIHNRIRRVYNDKLDKSLQEKQKEFIEIKQIYRSKLLEFEEATKKFQGWYDEVLEENQRQVVTNQALTTELEEKETKVKQEQEIDLQNRLIAMEYEYEKSRQSNLFHHEEQIKLIRGKYEAQHGTLMKQYENHVESMRRELEAQRKINTDLKEKVEEKGQTVNSSLVYPKDPRVLAKGESLDLMEDGLELMQPTVIASINLQDSERRTLQARIDDLVLQLTKLETEKQDLLILHSAEITELQKKLDTNNQNLRTLITETKDSVAAAQSERQRMHAEFRKKEQIHRTQMIHLSEGYGKKIQDLTGSVKQLQRQLLPVGEE